MRVRFLEKSAIDKKKTASPRNEPATEELQYGAAKEGEMAAEGPSRKLHEIYTAADGDYVRVVGDRSDNNRQFNRENEPDIIYRFLIIVMIREGGATKEVHRAIQFSSS